jgi:hypothetical protein
VVVHPETLKGGGGEMAEIQRLPGCCAIREIHGLSFAGASGNPEESIRNEAFWKVFYHPGFGTFKLPCRWLLFSQARHAHENYTYGEAFRDYILTHQLGAVHEIPSGVNPNTNRTVRVWMWELDGEAIETHFAKLGLVLSPAVVESSLKMEEVEGIRYYHYRGGL